MEGGITAIAIYSNDAEDQDELSFKINDSLVVLKENFQNGWHLCEVFLRSNFFASCMFPDLTV